jgi:hypothetical protein
VKYRMKIRLELMWSRDGLFAKRFLSTARLDRQRSQLLIAVVQKYQVVRYDE